MARHASTLFVFLLLSSAAAAETVYKYRGADGQMTYSNRPMRGAELVETFEYRFAPAIPPTVQDRRAKAAVAASTDANIKRQLAALDRAWSNVQTATRVLESAEARLAEGEAPLAGENTSLATAPVPVPQSVGGAAPAASPAVGGPMGTVRGGGRNADYHQRLAVLEAEVVRARARLDEALKAYNQLR
jgi:hypothetical protein